MCIFARSFQWVTSLFLLNPKEKINKTAYPELMIQSVLQILAWKAFCCSGESLNHNPSRYVGPGFPLIAYPCKPNYTLWDSSSQFTPNFTKPLIDKKSNVSAN